MNGYRDLYVDKELLVLNAVDCYDLRGHIYKNLALFEFWDPIGGKFSWWGAFFYDQINKHASNISVEPRWNDPEVKSEHFSLGWLRRMAR